MPSISSGNEFRTNLSLAFVALFWSGLTLAFDVTAGYGAVRQLRALSFPRVPGLIQKCEMRVRHGKGTSYYVDLKYSYDVAGISYEGTTYRQGLQRNSKAFADSLVQTLVPGQTVDVFYDPQDPAAAVLHPGIEGNDVFLTMFMTPFNMVMLGLWAGLWMRVRHPATGGYKLRDDGCEQRLAVAGWSPVHAAGLVIAFGSFAAIFLIGFPTHMDPSLPVALGGWVAVLCGAAMAGIWTARRFDESMRDLVISRFNETLTLPVSGPRREPLTVPWSDVASVTVDSVRDTKNRSYFPVVMIQRPDGSLTREIVAEKASQWSANTLAAWLRAQIGVPQS
ncbi:MAG: DUF3592 domain-containing protein [Planctomycetes bacterium]|nr:DUF3592 domain-containing protein [Planctomycetota bacterium]